MSETLDDGNKLSKLRRKAPWMQSPVFTKLHSDAQITLESVLTKMNKRDKNATCKYLSSSFVGLHTGTIDKASEAFLQTDGRFQLKGHRNTGSFGVSTKHLQKIDCLADNRTEWWNDEVSYNIKYDILVL